MVTAMVSCIAGPASVEPTWLHPGAGLTSQVSIKPAPGAARLAQHQQITISMWQAASWQRPSALLCLLSSIAFQARRGKTLSLFAAAHRFVAREARDVLSCDVAATFVMRLGCEDSSMISVATIVPD
jgi:hypothetical protein